MKYDAYPPGHSPKSDRRALLKTAALGMASLAAPRALAAAQPTRKHRLIINTLGGLADYNDPGEGRMATFLRPSPRVIADARASGVTAMNVTIGVCGEDHVGLGTDNPISGIDHFDAWRAMWDQAAVARAKAGVGAAGEVGGLPLTQDLLGPGQFDLLSQRMAKRGYSAARIDKVLGLNFLRYAQSIWGA